MKKGCTQVSIPTVDNSQERCDGFIYSECVNVNGESTLLVGKPNKNLNTLIKGIEESFEKQQRVNQSNLLKHKEVDSKITRINEELKTLSKYDSLILENRSLKSQIQRLKDEIGQYRNLKDLDIQVKEIKSTLREFNSDMKRLDTISSLKLELKVALSEVTRLREEVKKLEVLSRKNNLN